jgi:uncharacterized repeat protein (TIGR01451 family)
MRSGVTRSLVLVGLLCVALLACASAASAATPAPQELGVVCSSPLVVLVAPTAAGNCKPGQKPVSLLPGPTALCVGPLVDAVYLAPVTGSCARPFTSLTVPSATSDTYFCVGVLGLLRVVATPKCPGGEPVHAVTKPPVAVNDLASVTDGATTAAGNVLANDLYITVNPVTVTKLTSSGVVTTTTTGFKASVADGSTLTVSSTGAYSFTPSAAFFNSCSADATDDFGYTITNAYGQASSASLTVTLVCPPRAADLSIVKTDNVGGTFNSSTNDTTGGTVEAGASITYTVEVSNTGPDAANGATVSDLAASALTDVSWTAVASGGASGFTTSGTGNIIDTVDLPADSTITYTINATVLASASGSLSNTANLTPPASVTDTNSTESSTDTVTVTPQVTADLSIFQTDNVGGTFNSSTNDTTGGEAPPGATVVYTVLVSNGGPDTVTGATVSDSFPAGLTNVSWTVVASSGGASGFTPAGAGSIDDTVDLPSGSSVTYTIRATVLSSASGSIVNTATVTPPASVTDTNDHGSSTDTITLTS